MFKLQKYFLLRSNKLVLFLFPLIALVIVYSWFNTGHIISNTSEENLSILHSAHTSQYYSSFWYPIGGGVRMPYYLSRFPVFYALGFLDSKEIPAFIVQATLLFSLMLIGMFSMYLLIRRGLNQNIWIGLIGSTFYLLNIFSMTQVWKRFLYHGIFLWAYFPLFIFLWNEWIEKRRIKWLLLFLLTSVIFSYTFTQPAFLITVWVSAGVFSLVKFWKDRKNKNEIIKVLSVSLLGFILWIMVNLWWFYPLITLSSSSAGSGGGNSGSWQTDLSSAEAVSQSFPIREVVLLRQSWYLGKSNDWNNYYYNPLIILISLGALFIMLYGVIKGKQIKHRGFLISLGLVGLFVSKGTNFPFGYTFFYTLFSKITITTALRNPYEKFGIVWLLPYTIFFALGFYKFVSCFKAKAKIFYSFILLVLFCVVLVLPMWNGDIFPPKHRVTVPAYYLDADNYLKERSSQRIFNIPFLPQLEKRTYSWGYIGEDPTEMLFSQEPLSEQNPAYYNRIFKLFPNLIDEVQFPKILGLLGVDSVILHKDSIYPKIDYPTTVKFLDQWEGITSKQELGDLRIYSLNRNLIKPEIYSAANLIVVDNAQNSLDKILKGKINPGDTVFILQEDQTVNPGNYSGKPVIDFNKVSNMDYVVKIKQSKGPFVLIFNDTFDKSWKAKINSEPLGDHFIANGFVNGWIINKEGDFTIEIKLAVWPWD